ncbi:hypothetical protein O3619_02315 [Veillonella atypica]
MRLLQQYLPLAVLKQSTVAPYLDLNSSIVGTVLTACGIETKLAKNSS